LRRLAVGLAGPEALDCGWAQRPGEAGNAERLKVSDCVQQALMQGRPFHGRMTLPGIDSTVVVGFTRAPDGALYMLWYDSDTSGADETCRARVWRTRCARLRPDLRDATRLSCDPLGEREDFCSESDTRRQVPTEPRAASGLACTPTSNRQVVCEQRVTSGDAVPYQACGPSRVPAWLCTPRAEPVDLFPPGASLECVPRGDDKPLYCTGGAARPASP
jgi:hypothetical protein